MGKSKSKSNSRSISKWKRFFSSGSKGADGREESSGSVPPQSPIVKSNSSTSGLPKPKSVIKRKTLASAEDDAVPKTLDEKVQEPPSATQIGKNQATDDRKPDKGKKEAQCKSEEHAGKQAAPKKKDEKKDEQDASVFEEVEGPAAPAQTGTRGIKNKMRWKIDVEGADLNGDQRMPEVLAKLAQLRKKSKMKKCKVLKANEKVGTEDEEEQSKEIIISSARVLQLIKLEALITKELSESEQEILRGFCRSGDHEDKAEVLIEKIVVCCLNAVVSKNEYVRHVSIPGQLRLFAVDEKNAKYPMMALLMARKDLLYVSWSKPNRDVENTLDGTWCGMATKKTSATGINSTSL